MATYCTWNDVLGVYPEAGSVITSPATQTEIITKASKIVDSFLRAQRQAPLEADDQGDYDSIIVEATACLAADLVSYRRIKGPEDIDEGTYLGSPFRGTYHGHRGMGLLVMVVQGVALLVDDTSPGEADRPIVTPVLTTTNGTFYARFAGKRFDGETRRIYRVSITSAGGTVVGNDLTYSIVRDNDEPVWSDQAVVGTEWIAVEYGLEIRFVDAAAAPVWTQNDYWLLVCVPPEDVDRPRGVHSIEVNLA